MGLGNRIVSVVCAICLAVSFVAAGFVAVAVPDNATTSLADAYAGTTNPTTPFSHEELCDMALAGKRYTFDRNDRFALNQAIYDINAQAEADGRAHRGSLDTALWDEMAARDKVSGADMASAASTSLFFGLANTLGGSYDEADDLARMRILQPSSENVDMLLAQASDTYVLDPEAIEQALGRWSEAHPDDYIAVVVNNAGIRRDNLMVFMQNDEWHRVLDGFFYVTRRLLKEMLTHRWGRIVNMASLSGIKGLPGQANYSAAKAALLGATKALAQEVAPRKVTVNAVAPGFIETDMTRDLDEKEFRKLVPAGRFGKPEEVAALVAFLVSDDAAYITGEVISINGGLYT